MDQDLSFTDVRIRNLSSFPDLQNLASRIEAQKGVENASFTNGLLHIEYYPYALSLHQIKEILSDLGCLIDVHMREKNPLKRFINRLGESNQKNFGDEELTCCDLNNPKKSENQ